MENVQGCISSVFNIPTTLVCTCILFGHASLLTSSIYLVAFYICSYSFFEQHSYQVCTMYMCGVTVVQLVHRLVFGPRNNRGFDGDPQPSKRPQRVVINVNVDRQCIRYTCITSPADNVEFDEFSSRKVPWLALTVSVLNLVIQQLQPIRGSWLTLLTVWTQQTQY